MGRDKLSDEAQAYMDERLANFELDENAWDPFSTWTEQAHAEVDKILADRAAADPNYRTRFDIIEDHIAKTRHMTTKEERHRALCENQEYWAKISEVCIAYFNRPTVQPYLKVIKHFEDMFKPHLEIEEKFRKHIEERQGPLLQLEKAVKKAYPLMFPEPKPVGKFEGLEYLHHPNGWQPKHKNKGKNPYREDFYIKDEDRQKIANIDQYSGIEKIQISSMARKLKAYEEMHADLFSRELPKHREEMGVTDYGNFTSMEKIKLYQSRSDYKSRLKHLYDENNIFKSYSSMLKEVDRIDWPKARRSNIIQHANKNNRTVFDYKGFMLPEDERYFKETYPEIYNPKPKDEGFNFENRLGIPASQRKSSNELQEIKETVSELKTSIDEIKEHTEQTVANDKKQNQQTPESEPSTDNEQTTKQVELKKSVLQQDKSQKHNDNESLKSLTDDLIVNQKLNK